MLGDGGGGGGDGHEARQVAVLDEVVLGEPDEVETEAIEEADLLQGLGVDVLQRVRATGRAAEVVHHAEPQRGAPGGSFVLVGHAGTVRQVPPARANRYRRDMANTATVLALPPLTDDLEVA